MRAKLTAGSEVDAYCTKCRLDLGHRIVAMVGDTIRRVECLTCHGQHTYRAPRAPARTGSSTPGVHRRGAEPPPPRPSTARDKAPKATSSRAASAAAQARAAERARWEQAVLGKEPDEFLPYAISATFAEGQLVTHAKFGRGVVVADHEPGKVEILFSDSPRKLAHGRANG